ncbi:MAG: alpha/beta hydrolase [Bacteroidetes bacterium]|nr:alpha/beta hydrolase [Bacteroidota bacterium]
MSSPTNYFIGGIASDERLFKYQMVAVENAVYLPFPKHDKKDTIETYAKKFIPLIDTTKPFNIISNSMGGIMTMELIKHVHPEKVVLISSIKSRAEMPFKLKFLHVSKLHKILPGSGFINAIKMGSLFKREVLKTPALRKMAISMAKNNPPDFLYWCINAIINWKGDENYRKDIIHIHGTKDEVFPFKKLKNAIPILNGTHQMILNKSNEVNKILVEQLNKPNQDSAVVENSLT